MTLMAAGKLSEAPIRLLLDKALANPDNWQVYLVKTDGRKRTPAQNKLFRVVLRKMAQQQGRSVDYWHEYLVERFLGYDEVLSEDGYVRRVLCSTGDLSVAEFQQFLTACLNLAVDHQVDLS